jgi:glutathione peroxidase-family protein
MSSFTEFTMAAITGEDVSFERFDGMVSLVVNVASK